MESKKSNRGGARPGAGRKKRPDAAASTPPEKIDQSAAALKDYASQFAVEAINGLVKLARLRKTPAGARVMAWKEVLDRGHGRPPQAVTGAGGGPVVVQVLASASDERL